MLETTHEYMNNPSTGTSSVQWQYTAELLSEVTGIRGQTDLDYTHRPRYDIPSPGLDSNHALPERHRCSSLLSLTFLHNPNLHYMFGRAPTMPVQSTPSEPIYLGSTSIIFPVYVKAFQVVSSLRFHRTKIGMDFSYLPYLLHTSPLIRMMISSV